MQNSSKRNPVYCFFTQKKNLSALSNRASVGLRKWPKMHRDR